MSWLQIAAFAVPGWLALSVLACLAFGRATRIRDRRRVARPVPLNALSTTEWDRLLDAVERED